MIVHKRIIHILIIMMSVLIVIMFRLAYVQLIATKHFSSYDIDLVEESIKQRTQTFRLHSGRGFFTDRKGESLHVHYYPSLIMFPFLQHQKWPSQKIANIIGIEENLLTNALKKSVDPFVLHIEGKRVHLSEKQMKQINELKIPGVYAHYVQERTENLAPHLIGVVGENTEEIKRRYEKQIENGTISPYAEIGVSGMQRSFDPFLLSQGDARLAYFVDNLKRPLFGTEVKFSAPASPYHPTQVETTIDKTVQEKVIRTLKEVELKKGGAVLIDIKTNDLLALVSTPSFDVNFPFHEGARNHLITAYTPGSIFKIVVAAAAIDTNLVNKFKRYDCDKNLYGDGQEPRNLGPLSFQESFAQSCNYTFGQLANELVKMDQNILHTYAEKLGLIEKVGWTGNVFRLENIQHFPEEEVGRVTKDADDISSYKAITQTAIGQKNVQLTPLAVANMFATIARGGEKKQVRGASKIKYENGTTVVEFPAQKMDNSNKISLYTAMRLQELLASVVKLEKGTAHSHLATAPYKVAGKTGTVELGVNNEKTSHWFAGYFPAENPHYALVIVDLEHKNSNLKTLKAYRKLVDFLYEYDTLQNN